MRAVIAAIACPAAVEMAERLRRSGFAPNVRHRDLASPPRDTIDIGGPVGILSVRDIVRHIAEHYPKEFLNLPPDPQKEARARWGG